MIDTVLMPNLIAMLLLLVLLSIANSVSWHIQLLDSKIFVVMIICNFLQCSGEIIAYSIDGITLPGFRVIILLVNAILFIINIFFSFLWVIYADYKIYESVERVKKRSKKLILPALVIMLGSVINLFVPVFFRVTPDNQYQRTVLYLIPYIVTYFYLLYGTVFIYKHKNQARKYIFMPAVIFMMPILIGSGVQFFFYKVSTVWVGVAIALVAVYINFQNEVSYIDTLSGLYTRIYLYQYLETLFRKKGPQKKIVGIMVDIDDFKKINDTYGHLTGDDAIRTAGKILYHTHAKDSMAFRFGGDEFVIIQHIQKEEDIVDSLNQIEKAEEEFNSSGKKEYKILFSKGYSVLDFSEDTVDSFLERMDLAMYEVKKERKNKEL